jgi:hypothetical protein
MDLVNALSILNDGDHQDVIRPESSKKNITFSTHSASQDKDNKVEIEVASPEDPESTVVQTDVYITKTCAEGIETGKSAQSSSVSTTRADIHLHAGRPDWDALFHQLKDQALQGKSSKRVAVVACGPSSLVERVKHLCRSHSKTAFDCSGVTFDFHEDIFAY